MVMAAIAMTEKQKHLNDISSQINDLTVTIVAWAKEEIRKNPRAKWVNEITSLLAELGQQGTLKAAGGGVGSLADQENAHSVDPNLIGKDTIPSLFGDSQTFAQDKRANNDNVYQLGRDWAKRRNPHYQDNN